MASRRARAATARPRREREAPEPAFPWLAVLASPVVLTLACVLWLAQDREGGILALLDVSSDVDRLHAEVADLGARRDLLRDEIEGLRNDARYIERHAREDLEMARPGEIVIRLD